MSGDIRKVSKRGMRGGPRGLANWALEKIAPGKLVSHKLGHDVLGHGMLGPRKKLAANWAPGKCWCGKLGPNVFARQIVG